LKLEVKRLKEDIDRNKKSQVEKIKQQTEDFQHERLQIESLHAQTI
jgi:hypothetical protein